MTKVHWFKHITRSLKCPQSNGQAECAVQEPMHLNVLLTPKLSIFNYSASMLWCNGKDALNKGDQKMLDILKETILLCLHQDVLIFSLHVIY